MIVLEAVLKRDRAVVVIALSFISALAQIYILTGAGTSLSALDFTQFLFASDNDAAATSVIGAMSAQATWTLDHVFLMFVMWLVMMVAMMLPNVGPAILLFALSTRRIQAEKAPFLPTTFFVLGYLTAWSIFCLIAMALQWATIRAELLSPIMAVESAAIGGVLLLLAGLYQFSTFKQACLKRCRRPTPIIGAPRRPGQFGAFHMGLEFGSYCVGCCWALMALMFVGGIMNIYCMVGLALVFLLEKTFPSGERFASLLGIGLVTSGGTMLLLA